MTQTFNLQDSYETIKGKTKRNHSQEMGHFWN